MTRGPENERLHRMSVELPENVRLTLLFMIDTAERGAKRSTDSPYEDLGYKTGALASVADVAKSLLARPGQPCGAHVAASWNAADRRRAEHQAQFMDATGALPNQLEAR